MILVSKCLAGEPCRYDGGDNLVPEVRALVERGEAVAVCPEAGCASPLTADSPHEARGNSSTDRSRTRETALFSLFVLFIAFLLRAGN